MRLDVDLVKALLEKVEAVDPCGEPYCSENVSECYHLRQMIDAGLVEGWALPDGAGDGWGAEIRDLTYKGHEFLAHARTNQIWEKAKSACMEKGVSLGIDAMLLAMKYCLTCVFGGQA